MIYVDNYQGRFGRMIMCHMMSDESLEELHQFAATLGLKRSWFQDGSAPHYDLSKTKRAEAVTLGATELNIRGTREERREWQHVYRVAKTIR